MTTPASLHLKYGDTDPNSPIAGDIAIYFKTVSGVTLAFTKLSDGTVAPLGDSSLPATATNLEMTTGTQTALRMMSPALVADAIAALSPPPDLSSYATTSAMNTALALKAALSSPTFSGTPSGPTAAPGTNTTQFATTAFSAAAIALAISPLAPLVSPALSGTPTAPTAGGGNNTTQLATTAFVQAAIAGVVSSEFIIRGGIDCSASPNYPAGTAGDVYRVTVAGKIGGSSGAVVSIGDTITCFTTNAGGTQGAVGANWNITEANIPGITTVGTNLITLANPGALTVPVIQVSNAILARTPTQFLGDMGGTTVGVNIFKVSGAPSNNGALVVHTDGSVAQRDAANFFADLGVLSGANIRGGRVALVDSNVPSTYGTAVNHAWPTAQAAYDAFSPVSISGPLTIIFVNNESGDTIDLGGGYASGLTIMGCGQHWPGTTAPLTITFESDCEVRLADAYVSFATSGGIHNLTVSGYGIIDNIDNTGTTGGGVNSGSNGGNVTLNGFIIAQSVSIDGAIGTQGSNGTNATDDNESGNPGASAAASGTDATAGGVGGNAGTLTLNDHCSALNVSATGGNSGDGGTGGQGATATAGNGSDTSDGSQAGDGGNATANGGNGGDNANAGNGGTVNLQSVFASVGGGSLGLTGGVPGTAGGGGGAGTANAGSGGTDTLNNTANGNPGTATANSGNPGNASGSNGANGSVEYVGTALPKAALGFTTDQLAALLGTGTPNAGNPYVTQDTLTSTVGGYATLIELGMVSPAPNVGDISVSSNASTQLFFYNEFSCIAVKIIAGAGSGSYAANYTLPNGGQTQGAIAEVNIELAASVNGTINLIDTASSVTMATVNAAQAPNGGASASYWYGRFRFSGVSWHPLFRAFQI